MNDDRMGRALTTAAVLLAYGGDDGMSGEERFTMGLVIEVLDVLDRHGYRKADDQHTGRAIGLLGDVAKIYAGERDEPVALPYHPQAEDAPLNPAGKVLTPERLIVLTALDDAIAFRTERAGAYCADCRESPAELCESHQDDLDTADTYRTVARELGEAAL
jgi:hypothetical protein